MENKTGGVIGMGLMGGSLCKALGERGHRILGKDTDEHVQKYALLTGTVGEELTDEKVAECDYLFLAVYPGAAVETLRRLAPLIRPETVVCDLCGVKRAVCEPCFEIAKEHDFTFIGGHPMAGKQFSGIKYADGAMFQNATMILVPREQEDLFLAVYPGAAVETLRQLAPLIREDAVVCDLCGVKRAVCGPCFETAGEYGFTFIGGHPMAGKQFSGIKYADGAMFQNATMTLVPREQEDLFLVSRLRELLRGAGFRSVTLTSAEKHDEMIAFTSQLAHVVSNAYIKSPTAADHLSFSAGSYRDLTRVAKLNEAMWTELFLDNAEHLEFELDCLIRSLQEYRDAIAAGDAQTLCRLLKEGRERKETIDTEWQEKK